MQQQREFEVGYGVRCHHQLKAKDAGKQAFMHILRPQAEVATVGDLGMDVLYDAAQKGGRPRGWVKDERIGVGQAVGAA